MQLSHTRRVGSAVFDDPNLVSCAGLIPMAALARKCGPDDMALLRHGAMGTGFDRPYAPSTLGSFLREFAFGHVRQLDAVAARLPGSAA